MPTDQSPLARRLGLLAKLTEQELAYLTDIESSLTRLDRDKEIICDEEISETTYVVQTGWGCTLKLLPNGARQIMQIVLPGDCINLRSPQRRKSNYTFLTITDMLASRIKASRMVQIFNELPHLGVALLLTTAQDDDMLVQHLISLGKRTAIERVAHLFLELHNRLLIAGLATKTEFDCPLTQYHLADTLGLSAIHVNRMLRELREEKMMIFAEHRVKILDGPRMQEMTGFVGRNLDKILVRNETA